MVRTPGAPVASEGKRSSADGGLGADVANFAGGKACGEALAQCLHGLGSIAAEGV